MNSDDKNNPVEFDRRVVLRAAAAAGAASALLPAATLTANAADAPRYDVVIVGGGTAGAVLANRLTADPARKVLLLEAGKSYPPEAYPDPVRLQTIIGGDPAHDWGFTSEPGWAKREIAVPRGKVLGGSSAVNAGVAMRAPKADFDRWTKAGLPNWRAEDVLPFYKSIEHTSHGSDRFRGRNGPWPIHQLADDETSDMQRAFVRAAQGAGFARVTDFNGDRPFGAGPYPMNNRMGVRLNTGMIFLSSEVRARPNLTIRSEVLVDRVEVANGRAAAVLLAGGERIAAGEIILSAGAYGTPAILLRSGIGPAADLRGLNIPVVADLPVGTGLQDHPFFFTTWAAHAEKIGLPYPPVGAILWTRSSRALAQDGDLQVSAVHYGNPKDSPTGAIFMMALALTRPRSRGYVRLRDKNPESKPIIALNLLGEPEDRQRMVEGIGIVRRIAAQAPLAGLIHSELTPGASIADAAALEAALPKALDTFHHGSATAPMGSERDPRAVTDFQGRVRGVAGLRVADASSFPDIPSTATNPTVAMLAERVARWVAA